MTISQYIHSNEALKEYNFIVVYCIICELLKDGKVKWNFDDEESKNV